MSYSVTVTAKSLLPARAARLLVPDPREVSTIREARAWLSRMAGTWCAALLPTEAGFIGLVVDEDGKPARTIEYGVDPDVEPVEHDRDALAAMRGGR